MPRVIHFELHVDNPIKTRDFYKKVFNWEFQKFDGSDPYWLIKTGNADRPGINGGLMKRKNPQKTVYNTIDVPNIDWAIEKIKTYGGKIVVPKMSLAGIGFLAYFKDPEGNMFGVAQKV